MKSCVLFAIVTIACCPFFCSGQQASSSLPDAPSITVTKNTVAAQYIPPTQRERFKAYVGHTYGITSFVEAGVRAGIEQARGNPSQWDDGGSGYAERFGSAVGERAVRGTTEYLVADIFREDLRYQRCSSPCAESPFKSAFEDTFTARKGEDGHRAFSVARIVGPISGSVVAVNTWYPSGSGKSESVRQIGLTYGLTYTRNLIHELWDR